jgi:hypothetical protein
MKSAVGVLFLTFALAASAQDFSRSFAIVVGIRTYASNPALPNAQSDAQAMAVFLKSQQYEVTELYNQDANRAAILDAMDNVARIATSKDRVLFFFAGHGYTETRGDLDWGYIVPYDGKPGQSSSLIGMEQLRSESERMGKAHHQLFLMDSCYGGTIGMRDSPLGVDPKLPNYIEEISRRVAREALTAGGKDQRVEDGARDGHSRFTTALLEGLQQGLADLDGDGYVTFPELNAYVLSKAATSMQTPATAYLPGHGLGEYWFAVPGRVPGRATHSVSPEGARRDVGDTATSQPPAGSPSQPAVQTNDAATESSANAAPTNVAPPKTVFSEMRAPFLVLHGPSAFEPLPRGSGKVVLKIGKEGLVVAPSLDTGVRTLDISFAKQVVGHLPCAAFSVKHSHAKVFDPSDFPLPNVERVTIGSSGNSFAYFTDALSDKDRNDLVENLQRLCQ